MTFHALQDRPWRPYANASYEKVAHDYDLVVNEIKRFAGEEVVGEFTTIHWGEAPLEGCRALRDRGIRGLVGYFLFKDGKPWVSYYHGDEIVRHMQTRDYFKDIEENLIFIKHDIVINTVPLDKIVPHLEEVASVRTRAELMELMIHEQYFYPHFRAYKPDFAERVETAIRWCAENDYKPVFWMDGFIGVPED